MGKVIVIGQGGHSKVISDIIQCLPHITLLGYLDDKYSSLSIGDQLYYGPISEAKKILSLYNEVQFIIGIGNNFVRKIIVEKLGLPTDRYFTLVHPSAIISPSAVIGPGSVIMPHSVINADSYIGKHVIVNTSAIIEHDNEIEDYVHLSPNVTLTGQVMVKEGSHIGSSATIIPSKQVGEWSVIGAGATVINNIPPFSLAVGTPARIIKKEGDALYANSTKADTLISTTHERQGDDLHTGSI